MSKSTLLYVEDEENDVFFMRYALRAEGSPFGMQTVGDGQAAIAYLSGREPYGDRRSHPFPQSVLLDINLPIVSGFEVLEWIRKQPHLKRLPVIIFSSSGRSEDRERARALEADDYLTKPASGLEFRTIVRTLYERWQASVGGSP
jgi:CheY-like chemotaxis protein